jgi:alanyl-tRNA synthetase
MKTERLYYNDPYLLEFDATILETKPIGGRVAVVLDKTAFYPTSGGQRNDTGVINEASVIDCIEADDEGTVIHVVDRELPAGPAHCLIDAARRSDHMQQHSGQHVLSQAFVELFDWPTVSFHMGAVTCTIDLPAESMSREHAEKAEELANRVVRGNRNVVVRYLTQENIAEAGLRKPTERTGEIRIIDISGFDRSACGGTHVRMTGEIGPILITGLERAKKQTRVQFICGDRVLRYARQANRTLEAISQTISAPAFETGGAVRSLWNEHQIARKKIDDLESRLMDYEAAEFPIRNGLAIGAFKNRGIETLKMLAAKVCLRPGVIALLADEGDQLRVVFARSADGTADMSAVLKKILDRFGGRGGGRPNLAQGGGLVADSVEDILRFAAELVR